MSKLSEWMTGSSDNSLFIAGVAAVALTGATMMSNNQAEDPRSSVIANEIATLDEHYFQLQEMLENADVDGAVELAESMKEHISDIKSRLGIDSVDTATLYAIEELSVLEDVWQNMEVALRSGEPVTLNDVLSMMDDSAAENYESASLGM